MSITVQNVTMDVRFQMKGTSINKINKRTCLNLLKCSKDLKKRLCHGFGLVSKPNSNSSQLKATPSN